MKYEHYYFFVINSASAVPMSEPAATIDDQGFKTLIINGRSRVTHLNGTAQSDKNNINNVSCFTLVLHLFNLLHQIYDRYQGFDGNQNFARGIHDNDDNNHINNMIMLISFTRGGRTRCALRLLEAPWARAWESLQGAWGLFTAT